MSGLSYWTVVWYHECDYPSTGVTVEKLVAAPDEKAAKAVAEAPNNCYTPVEVTPFGGLPSLSRRRKPFTVIG